MQHQAGPETERWDWYYWNHNFLGIVRWLPLFHPLTFPTTAYQPGAALNPCWVSMAPILGLFSLLLPHSLNIKTIKKKCISPAKSLPVQILEMSHPIHHRLAPSDDFSRQRISYDISHMVWAYSWALLPLEVPIKRKKAGPRKTLKVCLAL